MAREAGARPVVRVPGGQGKRVPREEGVFKVDQKAGSDLGWVEGWEVRTECFQTLG